MILILALPKSGSTWLENLMNIDFKFTNIMPPQVIVWEQKENRSDNFVPQKDFVEDLPNG